MILVDTSRVLDLLNYSHQIDGEHTCFSTKIGRELFSSADGHYSIDFPLPDSGILKDQVFSTFHHHISKSEDWTNRSIWLIRGQNLLHVLQHVKVVCFYLLIFFKISYRGWTHWNAVWLHALICLMAALSLTLAVKSSGVVFRTPKYASLWFFRLTASICC